MQFLLETLAAGNAGYSLESLQQGNVFLDDLEATRLGSYLTTNRNLKRLGVGIVLGPAAEQFVSSLACSTVVELKLFVLLVAAYEISGSLDNAT